MAAGALLLGATGSIAANRPSTTTTTPYATANYPVTNYIKFVGGTAGKANPNLSTVYIGWINQQGGPSDIAPETTFGAQIATEYMNDYGGGLDGHPVKLVTCYIPDTVAAASSCGQSLSDNKNISAVAVGAVAIGNQALESPLGVAKKPLFFLIALASVDDSYSPGFALFGDGTHVEAPWATAAQYLHAKSVAIIYTNTPGGSVGPTITADALKYIHIPVNVVAVDPTTTDWTVPLIAAHAATAGLLIADVGGPACSSVYKAVKELKITTKIAVNAPCGAEQVAIGDGGSLPNGWYYLTANSFYEDGADPSGAAFLKVTKLFGQQAYAADPWDSDAFGQVLTIEKIDTDILKAGETITPARVAAAMTNFHGPIPNGAPTIDCAKYKAAPAVCNDKVSFLQDVNGKFVGILRWVGPPAGFVPPAGTNA